MPVVIREGSWRIWVYPRDHAPPHVHVRRPGGFVKVRLPAGLEPPAMMSRARLTDREVAEAVRLVEKHRDALSFAWSEIHGLPETN